MHAARLAPCKGGSASPAEEVAERRQGSDQRRQEKTLVHDGSLLGGLGYGFMTRARKPRRTAVFRPPAA